MDDILVWLLVLATILGPIVAAVVTAKWQSVDRAVSKHWGLVVGIPNSFSTKVRQWKEKRRSRIQKECGDRGHKDSIVIMQDDHGNVYRCLLCSKCGLFRLCSHRDKDGVRTENKPKGNVVVEKSACLQCGLVFWGKMIHCVICEGQYGGGMQSWDLGRLDKELEPLSEYMPSGLIQRCSDVEGCYRRVIEGLGGTMDTQKFREGVALRLNHWLRVRRNWDDGNMFLLPSDEISDIHSRDIFLKKMAEIYRQMESGECQWYRPRRRL